MCFIRRKNSLKDAFDQLYTIAQVGDKHSDFKIKYERNKVRVYVIDDEGFNSDPLSSVGYSSIIKHTKFQNIDDYAAADIILCDIDGVGGSLDASRQGIAVAENLKDRYPEKIVVLYTAKNVEAYGKAPKEIDGILRKQMSMSELALQLDEYYQKSKDVIEVWKRTKEAMLKDGVATKVIAYTEHYYCKSLLEKTNMFEEPSVSAFVNTTNIIKFIAILADVITIVYSFK